MFAAREDPTPAPEERDPLAEGPPETTGRRPPTDASPGDGSLPEDGTLGGYMAEHGRPPSFEGSDGRPYTVSVEVEQVGDLRTPFAGYLVFPRWSHGGREIVGHVQTPLLTRARSHDEVVTNLGKLTLAEIKELLEEGIERRGSGEGP